jgi:putative intracellular protease/amidase
MKLLLLVFILSFASSAFAGKKVLMMIPNDFMWQEYALPLQQYKAAGFEVTTAGRFNESVLPDRRNNLKGHALYFEEAKPIKVDMSFDEVNVDKFDAITFVAGNGAWHDFFPSDVVHKVVITSLEKNKILGLLCASTGLLGIAGNYDGNQKPVAEGKKIVGYYRVEGLLKNMGKTNYVAGGRNEPAVEVDGNLVTGRNPESSQLFGTKIVDLLLGRSPSSKKK